MEVSGGITSVSKPTERDGTFNIQVPLPNRQSPELTITARKSGFWNAQTSVSSAGEARQVPEIKLQRTKLSGIVRDQNGPLKGGSITLTAQKTGYHDASTTWKKGDDGVKLKMIKIAN